MSQLVGDCVSQRNSIVLIHATGTVRTTHAAHIGYTQRPKWEAKRQEIELRSCNKLKASSSTHVQLLAEQMSLRVIRMATS